MALLTYKQVMDTLAWLRREALGRGDIADAPPPVREARVLAWTLERLPVMIPDGRCCAGDIGADAAGVAEWEGRWAATRPTGGAATPPTVSPFEALRPDFGCWPSAGGDAHTTIDYPRIVSEGFAGLLAEIEAERCGASADKAAYLDGMAIALNAVVGWAQRFAELAEALEANESSAERREMLRRVASHCRHVPMHPARTFAEGLQSVRLAHVAVGISERSFASLSLGRLDRYLFDLYQADGERGVTEAQLEAALADFFGALNGVADPACTVGLGGLDGAGREAFNPLSAMILRVYKRNRLPAPLLAACVHEHTPKAVFDQYLDPELFVCGQPSFYGEESCRAALRARGVTEDELAAWTPNSCMGLMVGGCEWSNMWGSVLNATLPLELALNGGRPLRDELPFELTTRVPVHYASFDALFDTVCAVQDELVALLIGETERRTRERGATTPNPYVSAVLGDCIGRGRDRLLGGCRYTTVIVEGIGLVNAADALVAIRSLVFDEHRYTLADLVAATRDDFESHDECLRDLLGEPRYGNGDRRADEMARALAARFADSVSRHSNATYTYAPSFHTLTVHLGVGASTAATLDGRRKGEPLAKNIGTSPGRATEGYTGLIRSAAAIGQARFCGGQVLDLSFDAGLLGHEADRRKVQALFQTYFALGGLEIQVNAVSPDVLERAMADPAGHRDVLVRKAGYTARFVDLGAGEQCDLIARFRSQM